MVALSSFFGGLDHWWCMRIDDGWWVADNYVPDDWCDKRQYKGYMNKRTHKAAKYDSYKVEQCNGSKSYSILFHISRGIFGFPSVNYLNLAEMDCYKRPVTPYVIWPELYTTIVSSRLPGQGWIYTTCPQDPPGSFPSDTQRDWPLLFATAGRKYIELLHPVWFLNHSLLWTLLRKFPSISGKSTSSQLQLVPSINHTIKAVAVDGHAAAWPPKTKAPRFSHPDPLNPFRKIWWRLLMEETIKIHLG